MVTEIPLILPVVIAALLNAGTETPANNSTAPAARPAIVFVSRNVHPDPGVLPGFGPRDRTVAVGGRLVILSGTGVLTTLVDPSVLFDVADPCLSWDARFLVFSGLQHPDSNWRIYQVGIDGSGLKQLTFTDRRTNLSQFGSAEPLFSRYDDFDPCFLPDGRVICASTRFPSLAGYDQMPTSNLFLIGTDGGPMRRITTERNGGEEPTIDPVTGRIVYARWWLNRDLPSNRTRHGVTRDPSLSLTDDVANIWHAISIRSDGEGMKLYAGFPRTREGTQTYKPSIMPDGRLLSVFSPSTSLTHGTGGVGIRWFGTGVDVEHYVIGYRPDDPRSGQASATDPTPMSGETILFSYGDNGSDYGLYTCLLDGTDLRPVFDLKGTHELEPLVVLTRPVPPILSEEFPYPTNDLPPTEDPRTYLRNDTFRFDCMNIFTNGPVDSPMPDAPHIAVGARIRFFMNVQRQNPSDPDPSIFLKDAEVFLTGGVHEHDLPADVPLFEQVVDRNGRVLQAPHGGFAHVTGMNFDRMGSGTKCVGCHAGHSVLPVPINGSQAEWINISPSATVTASSSATLDDGTHSSPQWLVDRRARTGGRHSYWVSAETGKATVSLSWNIPVEVREFVLHDIPSNETQKTNISVQNCEILLYYRGRFVSREDPKGEVRPGETRFQVTPTHVDSAAIVISTSGSVLGKEVVGLAEIESIARISSLNYQPAREGY